MATITNENPNNNKAYTSNKSISTGSNSFCERFRNFFNGIFAAISKLFSSCFSCKSRTIVIKKAAAPEIPLLQAPVPHPAPQEQPAESAPPAPQEQPAETMSDKETTEEIDENDGGPLANSEKPGSTAPTIDPQLLEATKSGRLTLATLNTQGVLQPLSTRKKYRGCSFKPGFLKRPPTQQKEKEPRVPNVTAPPELELSIGGKTYAFVVEPRRKKNRS